MKKILAFACCLFAHPALADWQYTRWGMTVSEVEAASGGLAQAPAKPDAYEDGISQHLLSVPYEGGGLSFNARLIFDQQSQLLRVAMTLLDGSRCHHLGRLLTDTYGSGEKSKIGGMVATEKWWDERNGNVVSFLDMTGANLGCEVQYRPYHEAGAKGGL